MQKAIVRRTFDVVRNQRQEPIYAAKGDYGARYIQAIITADGVPYAIPENAVVTINAFRRDGKTNRFKGEVNADGSVIVPITQWMLEILGMVDCTISAVEEGGMLTTENFYVVANESSTNVEVSPDDPQYDLLTEVLLNEGTRQKQFSDMVEYINSLEQGKQGPVGPVGMHIGPEAPTDGQVAWIDTNEEPSAEEGGVNFDVVAKPGQVIAVKAVDVEGKPKEYKAVDLPVAVQPDWNAAEGEAGHVLNRTHYVDEKGVIHKIPNKFIDADWMATSEKHVDNTIVIPEQSVTTIWDKRQMDIQPGIIYDVHINGVVYPCEALNEDGGIILGNNTSLTLNNLPFCIFWAGGTATGGFFYKNSSVLSGTIHMKVTGHSYEKYNTLPKEYLPEISWNELTDKPFAEDTGDLLFSHTSTFATDNASEKIMGISLPLTVGAGYWMEINGDMVKCHCESAGTATFALYDTDGNMWLKKAATILYVYGQTAGTYTYKLYEMEKNIVLDPQYIPSSIARKSDIPEGGGGSASLDVTAQVGQTIIVKEVDADGKPTKWESADYQPRTHWSDIIEVLPKTTVGIDAEAGMGLISAEFTLEGGKAYTVNYNGVEYANCVCAEAEGQFMLGNIGAIDESFQTTEYPFLVVYTLIGEDDGGSSIFGWAILPFDGSATVTVAITETVIHVLPTEYAPKLCIVDIDASAGTSSGNIRIDEFDTTEIVNAILNDRPIYANFTTAYSGGTDYSNERLPVVVQGDYLNGESLSAKEILKLYLGLGACSVNNAAMTLQVWSLVNSKRYTVSINQASD